MQAGAKAAKDESLAFWRVELLTGVATDMLLYTDPEKLLGSVFKRLAAQTPVDLCFSYLVRDERLQLAFSAGLDLHLRPKIEWLNFGQGVCGMAAEKRCFLRHDGIGQTNDGATQFLRDIGVETFCCYPLLSGENFLGTLSFGSRKQTAFQHDELELQRAIADQVAVAFDRIQLVAQLARNNQRLIAANSELRRANVELEQIAWSASHDLREPVRHVNIFTELLSRRLENSKGSEVAAYLGFIGEAARRLEHLVDDLVQVIRVAPPATAAPEIPIDSHAVLTQVLGRLQPLIASSGARVNVRPLPALAISAEHLAELFERLIENAILHRLPGGKPAIEVFSPGGAEDQSICIRDNGRGIDPVHQENIFGLFKRLNPEEQKSSTGIGLTLCRKIVEQYHGQIWVESEVGQGAVFCFALGRDSHVRKTAASHFSR